MSRAITAVLLAALGLFASPQNLAAHLGLRDSAPAAGSRLDAVPSGVRLTFTEAVEPDVVSVQVVGPDGRPISTGAVTLDPGADNIVVVALTDRLVAGDYVVQWRVVGEDGHPVTGDFGFAIVDGAAGLAPPAAPEPAVTAGHHDPETFPTRSGFGVGSPGYVLVRWLTMLGMVGLTGAVAFGLLVLPLAERRDEARVRPLVEEALRGATRVGWASIALLAVAAPLRLTAQYYTLHGSFAGEPISPLLFQTGWGRAWVLAALAVILGAGGLVLATPTRTDKQGARRGWALAALAVLGLAVSAALSGHAAAASSPATAVMADAVHVIGAGGWIGSLLLVIVVGIPAALRIADDERWPAIASLVNAFSPTALGFAGLLLLTGLYASWIHLGDVSALWQSTYGLTLLVKLGLISGVLATGAYNWLRVKPALGGEMGAQRLRRTASIEIAIGVLVLLVTAVLVATSPPSEM